MVAARRSFLDRGHFDVLRVGLADLMAPFGGVLDVGCGEGTFTAALVGGGRRVVGVDISRDAVRHAARRAPEVTFAVASVQDLPVLDGSCDTVTVVMAPANEPELLRVVRPGGRIVVVVPGADHLDHLRRVLYEDYRPHDEVVPFAGRVEMVDQRRLRTEVRLAGAEIQELWAMTPYRWAAPVEGAARLFELEELAVTVDFLVTVFASPA